MARKLILADGEGVKSISPSDERFPEAWQWLSGAPATEQREFFARVAAAYAAYHLTADTIAGIPFVLYDGQGEEFDNSATWENNCGFLPNPSELIRLAVLSLMETNTAYERKTTDAIGYKIRGVYHLVPSTISPVLDPVTGELRELVRRVGLSTESYLPDDPRLIRMWRLDHTTELLPSKNTDAKAMLSAAGIVYYADAWIEHFFRRGGIKPVLIAMQGLVNPDKKDEAERSWTAFIRGLGKWGSKVARIFNAEKMDIKQFGAGVDDLKDSGVYGQALENIAIACRIPLSLLKANSANYATAMEEKATWYENKLEPLCNWLAYEWNRQLWEPLGLSMEFKPESLDPQQEDETERAAAISTFMDFLGKCPNADIALATAETFGYELTDALKEAITSYFAEKEKRRAEIAAQTQQPGGQPGAGDQGQAGDEPAASPGQAGQAGSPAQQQIERRRARQAAQPSAAAATASLFWVPTLDEMRDIKVWYDVALRRFKRSESLSFKYEPHYGGLPDDISEKISRGLAECKTELEIAQVFDDAMNRSRPTPIEVVYEPGLEIKPGADLKALADSLNRVADRLTVTT